MVITKEIKDYLDRSVLCWLATSVDGLPNVSPKEVFLPYKEDQVIIANIASPQTVRNIIVNPSVCLSFVDILVQKGYQLKGNASILSSTDAEYFEIERSLLEITKGKFPFASVTLITVTSAKQIIAPKYLLYPDTTEEDQITSAKKQYNIN